MNEDEVYLEIAKRYLESCERHILSGVILQEVIGFKGYHAFESAGGAFNARLGNHVPKSHVRKLNNFVSAARHCPFVDDRAIAAVAMTLHSRRNLYLYPEKTGSEYTSPKNQISMTDAKRLVARVRGIIKKIEKMF